MKKVMTVMLCILLATVLLVSCGNKKTEAAPAAQAEATPATTKTETKTETKAAEPAAAAPAEEAAPAAEAVSAASEGVVFKIANGAEPESLDPSKIQGVPEHRITQALFEGLVADDPETAGALPGVAESWDISDDGTVYTFHLRECTWSDGVAITANDVVYSWLRELAPETASPYAWFPAMFLKGASEYNAGTADASSVAIKAIDDRTFQMELIGPLPYVLGAMTHYSFAIVPQHAIEKYGDAWILPENFVGNGPFVLSEWLPQQYVKVTKNETYWDKDNVKLDTVFFYASEDNATMYNMFLNGEIDWVNTVPLDQIASAKLRKEYQSAPQLSTYYYVFQTTTAPIDDPNVRKALARAIDREALVENVTKGGQIPAWGIVPDMAGYDALAFPEDYDVESAQQYLADAGYPNGVGFPTITILYNTSDSHKAIAEFIQQEWKTNLGINVELVNQEWATYLSNRNAGNFMVARAGWVGDYQDPNTFLDMFVTGGGMNGGKYSNLTYDAYISTAAQMAAGEDRMATLQMAEGIMINDDQAIMPLYFYTTQNMIDTDVWGGWYTNTMDYHPVKDIYKK
ncbi:MAG: peptide ABC transporter substrate-binding protein [Sphaerochaetaceae bacterium]